MALSRIQFSVWVNSYGARNSFSIPYNTWDHNTSYFYKINDRNHRLYGPSIFVNVPTAYLEWWVNGKTLNFKKD